MKSNTEDDVIEKNHQEKLDKFKNLEWSNLQKIEKNFGGSRY